MDRKKIGKAVIIHQGALGDLVCTVPAIRALRDASEKLVGIGSERLRLLEYCGLLDQAVSADALNFHRLFLDDFQPGPNLRSAFEHADLAVSWLGRKSGVYKRNLETLATKVSVFREAFPPLPGSGHVTWALAQPDMPADEAERFRRLTFCLHMRGGLRNLGLGGFPPIPKESYNISI